MTLQPRAPVATLQPQAPVAMLPPQAAVLAQSPPPPAHAPPPTPVVGRLMILLGSPCISEPGMSGGITWHVREI